MCNRCNCGCNNYNTNEESACVVTDRAVRRLLRDAERILVEENRNQNCCENRCASQYRQCMHRCNRCN